MIKRFMSLEEQARFAYYQSAVPELESFVPVKSLQLSGSCYQFLDQVGLLSEKYLGMPVEFSAEGLGIQGDPVLRDIYLPDQENVTLMSFHPSDAALMELRAYLLEKRSSTGQHWITLASIHGHGKASPQSAPLDFSPLDVPLLKIFLQTQSLPTRAIAEQPASMVLMSNDFKVSKEAGQITVSDQYAYHPTIQIPSLDGGAWQEAVLQELGLSKDDLKGKSTADIVAAHLRIAAIAAEQEGRLAIRAAQCRVMQYSYFIVVDNYQRKQARIGILLEDTVTHTARTFYKELPLEVVNVEGDQPHTEDGLKEAVERAFRGVKERLQKKIVVALPELPSVEAAQEYHAKLFRQSELGAETERQKVASGHISMLELVTKFFNAAADYLDFGHYDNHHYAEVLSDVLRMYDSKLKSSPLSDILVIFGNPLLPKDRKEVVLQTGYSYHKDHIISQLFQAWQRSPKKDLEREFMLAFAYSANPEEQDAAIERFYTLFKGDLHER